MFNVVPVTSRARTTPASTAGTVVSTMNASRTDWKSAAAAGIPPVTRHHETARRGGCDQRAGHPVRGHAALAGPLTIDLHLDRRIVEGLHKLQVAQRGNAGHLGAHLVGVGAAVGHL